MGSILLLGIATGMRTMTPIAALCWAAWFAWLPESGWASWTTYLVSALVFTGFALTEYVGDTRPNTGSRKSPVGAVSRFAFGALVGALAAHAISEPLAGGILLGVVGAAIGTWGGFAGRKRGAELVGRDLPVALTESALALALAALALWQLHTGILTDLKRGAI